MLDDPVEGGAVLDSLGDHREAHVLREGDGRAHDGGGLRVAQGLLHEHAVDLELVEWQSVQAHE